jgi:hypothetical protein
MRAELLFPLLFLPIRIVRGASGSTSRGLSGAAGLRAENDLYPEKAIDVTRILYILAHVWPPRL